MAEPYEEYLRGVRQRAGRVLVNGTTSGSAIRLARDVVKLSEFSMTLLKENRKLRRQLKQEARREAAAILVKKTNPHDPHEYGAADYADGQ